MRTNKAIERGELHGHMPAISWKSALGLVFGAASRLHHYRDVHTHMMRAAMCELDCRAKNDGCDDE